MKARIYDLVALGAVSASALRSYLVSQGWRQSDEIPSVGHYYIFDDKSEIIVPNSNQLTDYSSVVGEIVQILSRVEERDELQILRDLSASDADVIRIKFPEAGPDGSLSVEKGFELVKQSREMILSAACSAVDPKRFYLRAGRFAKANDYMRGVRMGQSEQGSYILTLLSPVEPKLEQDEQLEMWPELAEEPFSRQVTRRLSIALGSLNEAIIKFNGGADFSAFDSAVPLGVSANLCEATANLIEEGEGLAVSLTWAKTRRGPEPIHNHFFSYSDKKILWEVARLFREREPRNSELLEGYVERLSRKKKQKVGLATLQVLLDGHLTSVTAQLDPEMYSQMADAHRDRRAIQVEGDLVREKSRWRLERPRHLKVKPPSSDSG